ncbi:putative amidase KNAG_0A04140 [Huiozyma naganishii CBS 8797]|uniref:Amidase domain-containing protein n=1 Tax=Huiozyma naganishii (strain ATCC MYA-139 / BCRC 22969 / CBS 8797 / KCTC 17520 / NBRC 10181 / NCYC 3082 / Yp74L-3) TaxID=1071383 RepID=J7REV7_HUIN7|nr:hypothetical protein KNAG_0A04140 [Kazachstania naganishii CBS 8797]CCK68093.1 hypothetical protein KNAG_0A04140 [Kazachstania naganishii CBS 8797]
MVLRSKLPKWRRIERKRNELGDFGGKERAQLRQQLPEEWKLSDKTVAALKAEPNDLIKTWILLPRDGNAVTHSTLLQLQSNIQNRKWTSYDVTLAFCHRAALIHQVVNCLSEICFKDSLATAKKYDESRPDCLPPLYGIPISVKDQCNVEGLDTTLGYLGKSFKPKTRKMESLIVSLLRNAGAIIYVKTTVPSSMMATETFSNTFGYTYNSINMRFSTGGSSGGEGALIAAHGSVLGLGTDSRGYIRIPASYHGIFGLKPSTEKVPYLRIDNSFEGREVIPSVIGPLARNLDDLRYFMDLVANNFMPWKYDVKCKPFFFSCKDKQFERDYVVGIQFEDGMITPPPSDIRALKLCEAVINEMEGFRTIRWEPPTELNERMYNLAFETDMADAGCEIKSEFDATGEPLLDILKPIVLDDQSKQYTVNQWWNLSKRISDAKQEYRDYYNSFEENDRPIVIISPSTLNAFRPGDMLKTTLKYILFVNLLNFPSLSLPISSINSLTDGKQDCSKALNPEDKMLMDYWNSLIDSGDMENFPICLQVLSPTFDDNEVCKFGALLSEKLTSL